MKIRFLDLGQNDSSDEHRQLGIPPLEAAVSHPGAHPFLRAAAGFTVLVLAGLVLYLLGRLFYSYEGLSGFTAIAETLNGLPFWSAVLVGFIAQAVDGALGMAYGVTATTFLLSTGVTPAVATASVHMAEIFTTGFSGLSHVRFGNVNRQLFTRLLVPGMIGGVAGAIVVTQMDSAVLKPFISAYLLLIGVYILGKALRRLQLSTRAPKHVGKLALFGGFVDSVGGGGWGPIVTTTLIGSGNDPRTTIGSVNFAEFFLSLASAATFAILVGSAVWPTIAGLVAGGLIAAPFAALLCSRLRAKTMLLIVGLLISALSSYNLWKALV